MRANFVFCFSGLFNQRYKVEPQFGSSVITTSLGSNVTLAWVCHTQGNYTLDKVYWSLFLSSEASRLPLLALKRNLDGSIKKTPMQDGGRVQWTGNATQEELSFVINDVRRSDDLWYRIRLKLVIPENDSFTVVHRKSYLRLKVAGKERDNLHITLKGVMVGATPNRAVRVRARTGDITLSLWEDTQLSQCLFPPGCINGYR